MNNMYKMDNCQLSHREKFSVLVLLCQWSKAKCVARGRDSSPTSSLSAHSRLAPCRLFRMPWSFTHRNCRILTHTTLTKENEGGSPQWGENIMGSALTMGLVSGGLSALSALGGAGAPNWQRQQAGAMEVQAANTRAQAEMEARRGPD